VRQRNTPSDREANKARIEAALEKYDRGEPLSEVEWTIVYWLRFSAGCHACGGPGMRVAVGPPTGHSPQEPAEERR
jgi:hypothetical protein